MKKALREDECLKEKRIIIKGKCDGCWAHYQTKTEGIMRDNYTILCKQYSSVAETYLAF